MGRVIVTLVDGVLDVINRGKIIFSLKLKKEDKKDVEFINYGSISSKDNKEYEVIFEYDKGDYILFSLSPYWWSVLLCPTSHAINNVITLAYGSGEKSSFSHIKNGVNVTRVENTRVIKFSHELKGRD